MAQRLQKNTDWLRDRLAEQNFEPIIDLEYQLIRGEIHRKPSLYVYSVRCSECGHKLKAGSYIYRLRHYIKHKLEKEQAK